MVPLWKMKGSRTSLSNYRSILLTSCASKCYQALLRRKVVAYTDAGSPSNQFGGRRGAQPVFLNHAVRAFLSQAHARARSSAILYVDVKSAFYKVLREAAVLM